MNHVRTIPVRTASASYEVVVGSGLLASLRPRIEKVLARKTQKYFIVTSPEIWALWSSAVLQSFPSEKPTVLFVPAGEASKRLAVVEQLTTQLSNAGADRGSVLLALGGGVIGDAGGFAAAIYMRGIDYIQLPTTLLSQVDSSVGGKTGVNLKTGKNLVGAFHHPKLVLADIDTLATLPAKEVRAGLFESIKAGLIRDRKLLSLMEREKESILKGDPALLERVIAASVRMKAEVVGEDERETGVRMILNFGHTLGHALEAVAGYGTLLHGEAVGFGMLAALAISRLRDLAEDDYVRGVAAIHSYGLPKLPPAFTRKPFTQKLFLKAAGDKKNLSGQRRFVLISEPGCAYTADDVTDAEMQAGIAAMMSL